MARELMLRIGDETAGFILFEDRAPQTCRKLIESLPITSTAIIAKVAGLEIMMRVPFFVDTGGENEITAQEAGNVCFVPGSQNVCFFCEDLPGLGPCSWIGKVTENLAGLQRQARKCRSRQGAVMEIYEEPAPEPGRGGQPVPEARFLDRFRAIRERMWREKQREIAEALDKAGQTDSWGSTFFPTLYAWEESVAARNAFLTVRATLLEGGTNLATLRVLTRRFLELHHSYFRMTNMRETTELLGEAVGEAAGMQSREELRQFLEELIRYFGRLHYWIEPLMPWEPIIRTFEEVTDAR